jgi:hypothetical protein
VTWAKLLAAEFRRAGYPSIDEDSVTVDQLLAWAVHRELDETAACARALVVGYLAGKGVLRAGGPRKEARP